MVGRRSRPALASQFAGTTESVVVQSQSVSLEFTFDKREVSAMSEVRLVVRGSDGDWSGNMHGSYVDRAIAALSADPTTLDEFETAVARFARPRKNSRFFANLTPGLRDEPYDA